MLLTSFNCSAAPIWEEEEPGWWYQLNNYVRNHLKIMKQSNNLKITKKKENDTVKNFWSSSSSLLLFIHLIILFFIFFFVSFFVHTYVIQESKRLDCVQYIAAYAREREKREKPRNDKSMPKNDVSEYIWIIIRRHLICVCECRMRWQKKTMTSALAHILFLYFCCFSYRGRVCCSMIFQVGAAFFHSVLMAKWKMKCTKWRWWTSV